MVAAKEEGREVHVSNAATRHERYNSMEVVNDIGVIQLRRDVDLTGGTCERVTSSFSNVHRITGISYHDLLH